MGDFPVGEVGRTLEGKDVSVIGCNEESWVVVLVHGSIMICVLHLKHFHGLEYRRSEVGLIGQRLVISGIWGPDWSTFGKQTDNVTIIDFFGSRCAEAGELVAKE
ncbi:unnamed protein product [Lactuca saligna]|uniref:Uncharacterized protein n=1 Tax=Lactuca saligna TaxID=75948 RepID=A0AA35ZH46_LACSI|nr:unnamed protein product [Lactuca saligna]